MTMGALLLTGRPLDEVRELSLLELDVLIELRGGGKRKRR